jgi:DNA-binding MarR family transcriptional regulator
MHAPAPRRADTLPLPPIQCACTALKRAARIVGRAYDAGLAPAGVTATQYAILVNIQRYAPIAQMRLATHLGLERTTLYRTVESLERRGWLTAMPTGEGVTRVLALTPAGTRVVGRARRAWARIQQRFHDPFGATRWGAFLATLDEIQRHFEGQGGGAPSTGGASRGMRRPLATRRRGSRP